MSNYIKAVDFESKDSLTSGNPLKIIKGVEINDEFNAIATAVATKADLTSPNLLGNPTATTQASENNSTRIATTAFVQQEINATEASVAITGGTITGVAISALTTDLAVADGGTGVSTLTTNAVLLGNGTSAIQTVAPSTSGNVLTSNGTTWTSAILPDLGIGNGQTWQNVTGSRTAGVTYTNSTGKPIQVAIAVYRVASVGAATFTIGGVVVGTWSCTGTNDVGTTQTATFIVPDLATYSCSAGFSNWAELR